MRLTMLRVDATIIDRVRAYATDHDLSLGEAAGQLLTAGLTHLAARAAGGVNRAASMTPEARRANARKAAVARWADR